MPFAQPGFRAAPALPEIVDREHRRQRRRRAVWLLLLVALVALMVAAWFALRPRPVPMAQRFRAQPASVGDVVREVHATGHVEAESTVDVGAEISGRIANVEVDYNDRVHAGQILARFEREALLAQLGQIEATLAATRATVVQARADVEQTTRTLARADQLFAAGAMAESDHDTARFARSSAQSRLRTALAQVEAQRSAAALARTNLSHGLIRAPIDGVVITRRVDPGQTVVSALQSPVLFSVAADLTRMRVVAAIDEADIGEVALGQSAEFGVNAYPDRVFTGRVIEVRNSPVMVQDVVTYGTVVEVNNADLALKPGMTATVRVRTGMVSGVLRVPNAALHFTPPNERSDPAPAVWVLSGESLRRVPVRPGLSDNVWTEIAPGTLAVGDRVLTELTHEGRVAYGIQH